MSQEPTSSPHREQKFAIPNSIEEAQQRRQDVIEQIKDIDLQLGDKCRGRKPGVRSSATEYFEWRQRAAGAKRIKEAEIAFLKRWIAEQVAKERDQKRQARANFTGLDPNDPRNLIQASYVMLCSLCDVVEYTEEERALIAALKNYLKKQSRG